MLSKVITAAVCGMDAVLINVETDISRGLPGISVVGLGDTTVKEAAARVKSAIRNSGFVMPSSQIVINLSPAWMRKRGSFFDLAIAIGILASSDQIFDKGLSEVCFIGELSLDGKINRCQGILSILKEVKQSGIKTVIIPESNMEEAGLFTGLTIYGAATFSQVCDFFNMRGELRKVECAGESVKSFLDSSRDGLRKNFAEVKGQEFAKRAIAIAVSGGHGLLMTGSPGCGKTMLAERIPDIMPELSYEEILELTSIYSVSGAGSEKERVISKRPFRAVGSSVTRAGLIGGGLNPVPGEITLAHRGVLFIDEFYELDRRVIDALRIPLESKEISFFRNDETVTYPADFLLVAASNPCKCGYYGSASRECICTPDEIRRYRKKVSGPILERIDINIELRNIEFDVLEDSKSMSTEEMKKIVDSARQRQKERYVEEKFSLNAQLSEGDAAKYIKFTDEQKIFLKEAYRRYNMTPRGLLKIKKLARTIADVDESDEIEIYHIAEALQYRERIGI